MQPERGSSKRREKAIVVPDSQELHSRIPVKQCNKKATTFFIVIIPIIMAFPHTLSGLLHELPLLVWSIKYNFYLIYKKEKGLAIFFARHYSITK